MDTAIEERDEVIAEAIVSGRSLRAVRKEFSLTAAELDGVLERLWPVSTEARIRMVKTDLGKLNRLLEVFYSKGLLGDPIAAGIAVKIWERLHELVGLNVQRIDLQITPAQNEPHEFDRIYDAIMRVARGPSAPNGNGSDSVAGDGGDQEGSPPPLADGDDGELH